MNVKNILLYVFIYFPTLVLAQKNLTVWGDQGNGTYVNPILNSDYSDPDVIRVKDKYYMVASDFHYMGIQILESSDMVNWRLVTKIYDRIDFPEYDENLRYGGGSWAPSIRFHDNKFWVYFCTPHEGLFMTNAENPEGPWSPLLNVENVAGWEDPCPFWDEDGNAYLGRSKRGAGPIIIHKMSPDGTRLLDDGRTVYTGPIAEGTKIHKKDGFYYMSIPEGGVAMGWQTVLRSKNIYGPYEKKVVLEKGMTSVNGPHQGAMVETRNGEWFFFHFQQYEPIGRVVHLQPMHWKDGWPVIGVDIDMNGIGEPVQVWRKPDLPEAGIETPCTDDEFDGDEIGPQWQFNHNPTEDGWSFERRKGMITFFTKHADNFKSARNTLAQKTVGYKGVATLKMDFRNIANGQRCGLACMGKHNWLIGICRDDNKNQIYMENNGNTVALKPFKGSVVYLRLEINALDNKYKLCYSSNGRDFHALREEPFSMSCGYWKGVHVGLYGYNVSGDTGEVSFDSFIYEHDGPVQIMK